MCETKAGNSRSSAIQNSFANRLLSQQSSKIVRDSNAEVE
jgi:hypothetical protein